MKCDDCGAEVNPERGVCINCGLVAIDRPIVSIPSRDYDGDEPKGSFMKNIDIKRTTTHSRRTTNPELQRAFYKEDLFKDGNPIDYKIIVELDRMCSALQLSDKISEEAYFIYKSVLKKDPDYFKKNYFRYAALAAYIVLAARMHGRALRIRDISEFSTEQEKHIRNAFRDASMMLDLQIITKMNMYLTEALNKLLPFENPQDVIRFQKKILKYIDVMEKNMNLSGKRPDGYVAALIYILGKTEFKLKLKQIAKTLKLSVPTITSRRNELIRFFNKTKR